MRSSSQASGVRIARFPVIAEFMPSGSPPEAPHYNGNTLSPASPKPIHLPDSQNIPVLQNQIDPIFNLVATHMEVSKLPQHASGTEPLGGSSNPGHIAEDARTSENGGQAPSEHLDPHINGSSQHENPSPKSNEFHVQQPSASVGATENPSAVAQSNFVSFAQNQSSDQAELANAPKASQVSQDEESPTAGVQADATNPMAEVQQGPQIPLQSSGEELTVDTGNIQALLDNLIASASSSTPVDKNHAPVHAPIPSTVPQTSSPSSAQTPISAFPTPAGLPPRPPPQDEPAIHPNYAPGQSIRSYHNPSASAATSTPSAQSLTSYNPAQALPPSHAVGTNGMPPPPTATFQQPPQTQQSGASPSQQPRSEDVQTTETQGPAAPEISGPSSFGTDRDKAYQEFLREEAVYVTEGTWDRFPQGSRLFVGALPVPTSSSLVSDTWSRKSVYRESLQTGDLRRFFKVWPPGSDFHEERVWLRPVCRSGLQHPGYADRGGHRAGWQKNT